MANSAGSFPPPSEGVRAELRLARNRSSQPGVDPSVETVPNVADPARGDILTATDSVVH